MYTKRLISIIVPTYNRAKTLERAVYSILNQDYKDIEIIIVDDGSTDGTQRVLESFNDDRIRIIKHSSNKGVCAALNTGLDNIKGEWFTFLGSDDEMVIPNALSTMVRVVDTIDSEINAITCNCIDSKTGRFTGIGINNDQYLPHSKILSDLSGEFWGITKSSLLDNDRFNENLAGFENIVWYKINKRSRRYYIHKGLRIYHTEGTDRVTKLSKTMDINKRYNQYIILLNETEFLSDLKKYNPKSFNKLILSIIFTCISANDKKTASILINEFVETHIFNIDKAVAKAGMILGGEFLEILRKLKHRIK